MASATVIPIPLTAPDWTMIFNLSERILHHMKVGRAVHSDPQHAFDSWIADHATTPPPPAMPPPPPPSQRPNSDVAPALRAVPVSPQQQPESTMDLYDDDDDDDDDEDSVIPTTEFMEK